MATDGTPSPQICFSLIWIAYLGADWIATFTLSTLLRRTSEVEANNTSNPLSDLWAFWAPFLLLHLGGPDTITAYSLEDNSLWLRSLLRISGYVVVSLYICIKFSALAGSFCLISNIPLLISGVIKCWERVESLRSASTKPFRDLLFVSYESKNQKDKKKKDNESQDGKPKDLDSLIGNVYNVHPEARYLHEAFVLFNLLRFFIENINLKMNREVHSNFTISDMKWDQASNLLEVELGYLYDVLYTKTPTMMSPKGRKLRYLSILCIILAWISFSIVIFDKHPYTQLKKSLDTMITYVLLVGALLVDIYGIAIYVFSNWTLLWLSRNQNKLAIRAYRVISAMFKKNSRRKAVRLAHMAQHNLFKLCIEHRRARQFNVVRLFHNFHERLGRYLYTTSVPVVDELKYMIHDHLQNKFMRYGFESFDYKCLKKILDERGNYWLYDVEFVDDKDIQRTVNNEEEFDASILIWHIATDVLYNQKELENLEAFVYRNNSKKLSDYMFHLMVALPHMMPNGISDVRIKHTIDQAIIFFEQIEIRNVNIAQRLFEIGELYSIIQKTRGISKF